MAKKEVEKLEAKAAEEAKKEANGKIDIAYMKARLDEARAKASKKKADAKEAEEKEEYDKAVANSEARVIRRISAIPKSSIEYDMEEIAKGAIAHAKKTVKNHHDVVANLTPA